MKKIVVFLIAVNSFVNAQNFSGKIEYQTTDASSYRKKEVKELSAEEQEKQDKASKVAGFSEEMEKELTEQFKKLMQKTYLLTFNKNEALFEEQKKLAEPNPKVKGTIIITSMSMSGDGTKYLNTKENIAMLEEDIMGDEYVVKDSLQKYNWVLTEESKKIGDYICFKATYEKPVSKLDMEEYEAFLKKKEQGKQVLFQMEKPKPTIIEAWWTADVPISFGPANYWGLPGLIVQLVDENFVYTCTKISMKKEGLKIKKPSNGKIISQKEYDKYDAKMRQQLEDNDSVFMSGKY